MRSRAKRWASEDAAYRVLRAWLLPGVCEACPLLAEQGLEVPAMPHVGDTLHHRRKRGASGALANRDNVVVACNHANTELIESHPIEAKAAGLVIREGHPEWEALSSRAWRLAHA